MKYACQNIQCAKYEVVYNAREMVNANGDEYTNPSTDCSLCGYAGDIISESESTPESEIIPLAESSIEYTATGMAAEEWVRESISQLWDRASKFAVIGDGSAAKILTLTLQKVLASTGQNDSR